MAEIVDTGQETIADSILRKQRERIMKKATQAMIDVLDKAGDDWADKGQKAMVIQMSILDVVTSSLINHIATDPVNALHILDLHDASVRKVFIRKQLVGEAKIVTGMH